MRLSLTMVAALGLLGCSDALDGDGGVATDDFIDMDTPPGNCSAETGADPCPDPGASTGVPEGGACLESNDCAPGTFCSAPFVEGQVGDFTCTAQCIPLMDESAWCVDSTACCDLGAVCTTRGLCVEGSLDDTGTAEDSGSGTTEGTGTEGTADSGTSSGGTTAGSEGSSGDTGASSGSTGLGEG